MRRRWCEIFNRNWEFFTAEETGRHLREARNRLFSCCSFHEMIARNAHFALTHRWLSVGVARMGLELRSMPRERRNETHAAVVSSARFSKKKISTMGCPSKSRKHDCPQALRRDIRKSNATISSTTAERPPIAIGGSSQEDDVSRDQAAKT